MKCFEYFCRMCVYLMFLVRKFPYFPQCSPIHLPVLRYTAPLCCVGEGKLQESIGPLVYGSAGSGIGSLILLEVFMDCETHTLITVATDRSFKLWDLALLERRNERKGSDTGMGPSSKAEGIHHSTSQDKDREQSKSFFKFSSSPRKPQRDSVKDRNPARGVSFIPCVGRIIPGTCLPPSLAKFVSCAAIDHPRYPFGTFAIVSKTNSIGIVQVRVMVSSFLSFLSTHLSSLVCFLSPFIFTSSSYFFLFLLSTNSIIIYNCWFQRTI